MEGDDNRKEIHIFVSIQDIENRLFICYNIINGCNRQKICVYDWNAIPGRMD